MEILLYFSSLFLAPIKGFFIDLYHFSFNCGAVKALGKFRYGPQLKQHWTPYLSSMTLVLAFILMKLWLEWGGRGGGGSP